MQLLDIREQAWAPVLRGVSLIAEAEIRQSHSEQAAEALGVEYGKYHFSAAQGAIDRGIRFLTRWPACLVAAMTGVAVSRYAQGTYWPALCSAAKIDCTSVNQGIWGKAFAEALTKLGLPALPGSGLPYVGPILMHAGIPAYCLGDFFRLLLERRRQEPDLDADSFLAWATAPRRRLRLSQLDKPAERFLINGGDYAHDVVDRTLDLLDRLNDPDPDFDAVRLPAYMVEEAKKERDAGYLSLSWSASRTSGGQSSGGREASIRRQAQPRIALDPYGQGIHVVLPAVGDTPDGVARWRVTADGEMTTVQSRAMWVGAAETTPETVFPLNKPVRTVLVSLAGREDLATELAVIDPSDPVLFFSDDGRRLSGTVSLPRSQVWVMHPSKQNLEFTGDTGQIVEPAVPFGWDGWRLCRIGLESVQAIGLCEGRMHSVEVHARPRLMSADPLPGVTTPFGSPVLAEPPHLQLPENTGAEVKWYAEIRRVGGGAPLFGDFVGPDDDVDIWASVPHPVLGAFEITVRGPLGRGLRRTVVVAEGLSVTYQPQVRILNAVGLENGKAMLKAAPGAVVQPATARFGSNERAHHVEYRTPDESEPLIITPPHVSLLCPGVGVTEWKTSILHLITEDFADAGRLLVRFPGQAQQGNLELAVHVRGRQVQTVPASGQQSAGLIGFDLARAADTIANAGSAQLTLTIGSTMMPVATVRPRRLASGAEIAGDKLVLRDAVEIEGLTAGVYLAYAPWRPPVELAVSADGTAELPDELKDAGPLRVLVRIEDPWLVSNWPVWPETDVYTCPAPGHPASADLEEESLSRFVAGEGELPELNDHLGWLWRLVDLAPELVKLGARADLADSCVVELCRRPRAALLSLTDAELGLADIVHSLIATGIARTPFEPMPWTSSERRALERLWAAYPAAAAIATGDLFSDDDVVDAAIAQCGSTLTEILNGHADPHATVGKFGPEAEQMTRWEPAQLDAAWQAAAVVPEAMLDADTRLMAARQMFDTRNTSSARAAAVFVRTTSNAAKLLIERSCHPDLADAIRAREPSGNKGWLGLPTMSIAMALLARLAARGDSNAALVEEEYRGKWANLALHAPDLVAIDLVLAEALVVAAELNKPEEIND